MSPAEPSKLMITTLFSSTDAAQAVLALFTLVGIAPIDIGQVYSYSLWSFEEGTCLRRSQIEMFILFPSAEAVEWQDLH